MAGDTPVQPPLNTPPIAPSKPNLFVSPWALFFTELANANNSGNAPSSAAYILAAANALLPNGRVGTTSTTIAWDYSASGQAKVNLRDTTVTPGTYGDATHVSQVTFDAQGRATAASNVAITATGTVTTTGSPVSGNLTKFSGATSITNGDLTGDVTTSGTLATTLRNGVATSVIGRAANSTGAEADIQSTVENHVLVRRSSTLGFTLEQSIGYWSPLSNGDPVTPELVWDSFGDTVSVWTAL